MGSLLGRNRAATQDPFYSGVPYATGEYLTAGPNAVSPSMENLYGGQRGFGPNNYAGRYTQGENLPQGGSPGNYGNYFMGNVRVRVIAVPSNPTPSCCQAGFSGLSGWPSMMPYSMPSMMPYSMPSSYSMPMAAPLMATASPLPVAYNPLVQGMYPMPSMSPSNWMTPSSFMSALSSGPMPYRPPGYDFPSNIGMVLPIPYGTPNPWFSSPYYNGYNSSNNFGAGSSYYSMPSALAPVPPPISYYPRPVSVPQPYSVPYPVPVPVPNIQQVPVPRPVSVVAPPIMAGYNYPPSIPVGAPLLPSQGVFTNSAVGQSIVMTSGDHSGTNSFSSHNPIQQPGPLIGQPIMTPRGTEYHTPSISSTNDGLAQSQPRTQHYIPPILHGELISDSGWLPKPPISHGEVISDPGWLPKPSAFQTVSSILSGKRRKRPLYTFGNDRSTSYSDGSRLSFIPRRRRHNSNSSASEADCPICQQQREKRRLRKHYGSSTVSSLLSSKESHGHPLTTNESIFSSAPRISSAFKRNSPKPHRGHPTRIKINGNTPLSKTSSSPILLRKSAIQEQRQYDTIKEVKDEEEKKKKPEVTKSLIDISSASEKSAQSDSEISL